MFIFGVIVGLVAATLVAVLMNRRQSAEIANMERTSSSQFRRITALEKKVADAQLAGAASVRDEKLRNTREFNQYKTLLRRADSALAQARADRANMKIDELSQAA